MTTPGPPLKPQLWQTEVVVEHVSPAEMDGYMAKIWATHSRV